MKFVTPNRKARMAQLGYLFKNTFTIFARSSTLIRPIVKMSIYACVVVGLFLVAAVLLIYEQTDTGWLLIGLGALLFVGKFFYYNRVSLVLSRMVYMSTLGQEPTEKAARKHLGGMYWQTLVLSVLDFAVVWIRSSRNKDQNFLINLILSGLAGLGDLISHFMLPAFAVDKKGFKDSLGSLRALKDNIPESLSGVFGMAIMNRVLVSLLGPFYFVGFLGGLVVGLLAGAYLPAAFAMGTLGELFQMPPDTIPLIGPETVLNLLPLYMMIALGMFLNAILGRIVDALKTVYYTLFYIRVNHVEQLAPELRAELDSYLKLEDGTDGQTEPAAAAW